MNILLISGEAWGEIFLSKHNYAITLNKLGHTVFFLNPPTSTKSRGVSVRKNDYGVFIVTYNALAKGRKYLPEFLFHFLQRLDIIRVVIAIKSKINIIWSFTDYYPYLGWFNSKAIKIFHPVDILVPDNYLGRDAQILFSVSDNILANYSSLLIPKYYINHGLNSYFEAYSHKLIQNNLSINSNSEGKIKVGYSGNLFKLHIDRKIFLDIISSNPEVEFYIWGPYKHQTNLGGSSNFEIFNFIERLKNFKNVFLEGLVFGNELIAAMEKVDCFLLCYQPVSYDDYDSSNSHKLLEYLSTGKTVISNYIAQYKNTSSSLFQMLDTPDSNAQLPTLFKNTILNLGLLNDPERAKNRVDYSLNNTYKLQVERIFEQLHFNKLINETS